MNLPNFLTILRMALVPVFFVLFYLGQAGATLLGGASGGGVFGSGAAGTADSANAATAINPTGASSVLFAVLTFAIFVAASATDAIDGQIARKRGQITNFGKLMDPLADKVLTTAAFICFVDVGLMPAWMLLVILTREFAITGLRGVAAAEGQVIAAGPSGKLKTVLQMVAIALLLLTRCVPFAGGQVTDFPLGLFAIIVLYAALALTVYSGIEYLWKGRKLLNLK